MPKPFKPEQFGRYLLTEKIATGGMAEIFNAKIFGAMGFEKSVVIKRILPQFAEDSEFLRMFITEAKLVCHLEHPNIVQVNELGEIDGLYYIAMEHVNGIDARHLWRTLAKRRQRLPGLLALFIVSEFLKGLDYAHRAVGADGKLLGVVHRDVSPSNILISYRGDVKIGDFGIALVQQESKTQAGVLKGKFGYMSPEQVAGMKVDHRSDIFAAGIVLAELLLGRRLFLGQSDFETLDRVLNVRLEVLDEHESALPSDVVKIVRRALRRELSERYQSAQEFADDIVEFLYDRRARITNETLAAFIAEHVAPYLLRSAGHEQSAPSVSAGPGRSSPPVAAASGPVVDVGARPFISPARSRPPFGAGGGEAEKLEDDLDLPAPSRPVSRPRAPAEARLESQPAASDRAAPGAAPSRGFIRSPASGSASVRRELLPLEAPVIEEPYRPAAPRAVEPLHPASSTVGSPRDPAPQRADPGEATSGLPAPESGPPWPPPLAPPSGLEDPLFSLDSAEALPGPPAGAPTRGVAADAVRLAALDSDESAAFGAIPVFEMDGETPGLDLEQLGSSQLAPQREGAGEELDLGSLEEVEEVFIPPPVLPENAGALVSGKLASADSRVMAEEPDFAGRFASRTLAKVLFRFAVVKETGLLVLSGPEAIGEQAALMGWLRTVQERVQAPRDSRSSVRTCTIHLQDGEPHLASADRNEEALVAHLIRTGVLTSKDVERSILSNPHRKPVAALLAAGLVSPLQVSRHVTAFVLANVADAFSWTDGEFAFFRGRPAPSEAFPTGLDAVGLVRHGISSIAEPAMDAYLARLGGKRIFLNRTPPARLERFGPDPLLEAAYLALSGGREIESLLQQLVELGSLLEAKRALYLLLECELAALG